MHTLHKRRHRPRDKVVLRRKFRLKLAILPWACVCLLQAAQAERSILQLCLAGTEHSPWNSLPEAVRVKHTDSNREMAEQICVWSMDLIES